MPARRNTTRSRKPGMILKFGVASLAILGLGGAMTAAAWQDTITYSADAKAHTFDLRANYSGSPGWIGGGQGQTQVPLPASAFDGLKSGETREFSVALRNFSTIPASVVLSLDSTGPLFDGGWATVSVNKSNFTLPADPNGYTTIKITVQAGDWNPGQGGYTGSITLTAVGTPAS